MPAADCSEPSQGRPDLPTGEVPRATEPSRSSAPMASCHTHFLGLPDPITSRSDRPRLSELRGSDSEPALAPDSQMWFSLPSLPLRPLVASKCSARAVLFSANGAGDFPSSFTEFSVIERAGIKSRKALVLWTSPIVMAGFRGPMIARRTATISDHQLPLSWPDMPRYTP